MHKKLMSKQEALAAMRLGLTVRNIEWDNPYHYGCTAAYIKNDFIWSKDKHINYDEDVFSNGEWQSIESFKDLNHLATGWYIYELYCPQGNE